MREKTVQKIHLRVRVLAVGLLLVALVAGGCVTVEPSTRIIGIWDGQLHGFPIIVEYTRATVRISGKDPVPYTIDGNILTLPAGSLQTYRVEFPSANEMIQFDDVTGTEQKYTRKTR